MKNRIIVPTGYMGSGSSAITDLASEFKDCSNEYKSFEYVFLHAPNGLFDLEDKLLLGNNVLRSDEAIRTFESFMQKLYMKKYWWVANYNKIIGEEFINATNDFISNIEQYNFPGYWYTHEDTNASMFLKLIIRKPFKILFPKYFASKSILKYKDGIRISYIKPDDFYKYSKEYIKRIINAISKNKENVIIDQLLLPYNLFRIDNYFDESLKVIVVERDPRDVFILNKYIWPQKRIQVPFPLDVKEFCKFYKNMRELEKTCKSKKVFRVKFEDMIYNYEKTVEDITNFLEFKKENHINKYERFNPEISIKNTQLFRNKKYKSEIKIIEKELSKYLYSFPYVLDNDVNKTVEME